jgi:hypothetical protein
MQITIEIDSHDQLELVLAMAMLQEKFPDWEFHREDYFQLYRKDDPTPASERHPEYYAAKVYLSGPDQLLQA